MDRYGLTDAVCYIVCGAAAFVTDVSVFVLSISVSASLLQPQSLLPLIAIATDNSRQLQPLLAAPK